MNRLATRLLALAFLFAAASPIIPAQRPAAKPAASAPTAQPLDINTATPAQLKALKGIGDAYAKRIVDGRPYTAKNQLITRGVIPQAAYDGIKDQIIARAIRK